MVRLGFLVCGLMGALLVAVLLHVRRGASEASPDGKHETVIRVGRNMHVSRAYAKREHSEVVIAADPNNAGRLLAGSMVLPPQAPYRYSIVAYRSSDGGKSWEVAVEPPATNDKGGFGDPAVAYGPDGSAYFAALAPDGQKRGHQRSLLQLRHSRDGGKAWEQPVEAADDVDRPFLAVDWTRGRFAGQLYCNCLIVGGLRVGRPGFYTSADAGKSLGPLQAWAVKGGEIPKPGQGGVLSDGTLVVPYQVPGSEGLEPTFSIRVRRSTTGGVSFLEEQSLWVDDFLADNESYPIFPALAADRDTKAFKDRLYLVWSHKTPAGYRVRLMLSRDKGATWTRPVVINEQPEGDEVGEFDGVLPAVAVSGAGVVGVSWFEWWNAKSGEARGHEYFRASVDGGATWLPRVRVTDAENHFGKGGSPAGASYLGDTSGLAADATGDFHPLWIDNRTGTRQVFTAAVRVKTP